MGAFPCWIGTTVSPYKVFEFVQAQAVTATFIRYVPLHSTAHAVFIASIARLIDRFKKLSSIDSIDIGTIGTVTACGSKDP